MVTYLSQYNASSFKLPELKACSILAICCVMMLNHNSAFADEAKFQTTLRLLKPITLTQKSQLSFQSVTAGQTTTVVTEPSSSNAVVFSATGEALSTVTGSVVESQILMISGSGSDESLQIPVDSFSTGGDLDGSGIGVFDSEGNLDDLRIGASAHIDAYNVPGVYTASATFRLTYN